jgi:hypothetical protein
MEQSAKSALKKHSTSPDAEVLPFLGNAATVIFLLRDYDTFGLAERVRNLKKSRSNIEFT